MSTISARTVQKKLKQLLARHAKLERELANLNRNIDRLREFLPEPVPPPPALSEFASQRDSGPRPEPRAQSLKPRFIRRYGAG